MRTVLLLLVLAWAWVPNAEALLCAHGKKKIVRVRTSGCVGNETPVPAEDLGQGPQGEPGEPGPAGPITGTLPSGVTLRGTFGMDFAASTVSDIAETSISFGFTLTSAPQPVIRPVNATPNDDCPGTVTTPEAAPGKLCIYEATASNVESFTPFTGDENTDNAASPFGALLFLNAMNVPGRAFVDGTWAVTAP